MLRQIIHIALSILLLVATSGISIKKHYCMGMLKYATLAVWQPACCGQETEMPAECCQDVFDHFQVDEDFQALAGLFIDNPAEVLIGVFAIPQPKICHSSLRKNVDYLNFRPPLLPCNMQVRTQTFLI